jgi:hypothetical protein
MDNTKLINSAFALKDERRKALKEGNIELADSLLKEYENILKDIPEDLVFAVSVY